MTTLLLNSDESSHTGRSGYPVLAEYLNDCRVLSVKRSKSLPLWDRLIGKTLRLTSVSSWYHASSFRLERKCLKLSPHYMVLHYLWGDRDWGFLDLWVPRKRNPLVATFHACPDNFRTVIQRPKRLKNLAAIILMSHCQRANFLEAGVPEDRIHVIPHGIDTEHFRPSDRPHRSTVRVLHVGSYRRNFDDLEAVCHLLRDREDVLVTIVTSPSIGMRFKRFSNVVIRSGLSDVELLQLYQESDCLIMTAEAATANNAILEGMSCGLPVVTQRVGGIPEYVNNRCAVLCEPDNAGALVAGIVELAENKELRAEMGRASRERALEFDWSKIATATQRVYDQVLVN